VLDTGAHCTLIDDIAIVSDSHECAKRPIEGCQKMRETHKREDDCRISLQTAEGGASLDPDRQESLSWSWSHRHATRTIFCGYDKRELTCELRGRSQVGLQ
jgi:hypothetical protein